MSDFKLPADQEVVNGLSLQKKMFVLFGGVCSLIVVCLALFEFFGLPLFGINGTYQTRLRVAEATVNLIADYKKISIENWLAERHAELAFTSGDQTLRQVLFSETAGFSSQIHVEKHFQDIVNTSPALNDLWLTEIATGNVLISTTTRQIDQSQQADFFATIRNSATGYAVELIHTPNHMGCAVVFGQAIYLPEAEKPVAILCAKADVSTFLQPLLHDVQGLGQSGEVVLLDQDGTVLVPLKYPLSGGGVVLPLETRLSVPAAKATIKGAAAVSCDRDYCGKESIATTRLIQTGGPSPWEIIVRQDYAEILQPVLMQIKWAAAGVVVSILVLLLCVYLVSRRITQPLRALNFAVDAVRSGDLKARVQVSSNDELGKLSTVFNSMVEQVSGWQAELEKAVNDKTEELNSAYQALQQLEARRVAITEITRNYLTNGELEHSLERLVSSAAKFTRALAGRFFHCVTEHGKLKITAVSKMCWADPAAEIVDSQVQAAFEEYAQILAQTESRLLISALGKSQPTIFDAEQYVASRSIPLPAGHPQIESLMLTPVSLSGKVLGVIALANSLDGFRNEDVACVEAFAAEAALLIHAESQELARAAAEETARLRSTFLANMSHELRTPLNVIIGMNQLLQGMKNSKVQQDYLEKIGFSAEQLLALINDVLDLSKISSGKKLALEETVFEAEELLYNIAQTLAFRQEDRRVELHVDISREIPSRLIGDSLCLTRVLNNLLSNALKFTPQGAVTLRVVPLEQTAERVFLDFTITDTGIGLSEQQLEQVFKPFVQVDNSSTRRQGGSGLGLTISRELCLLLGGDLTVESVLDQGSTFHFTLPFKIAPAAASLKRPFPPDFDPNGMPMLIVNSCPICSNILPPLFEAAQFKVTLISSGSGALMLLNSAQAQGNPYQLVLLGVFLDDMSGLEFAEHLATQNLPGTRRILMVNPADMADVSARAESLALAGVVPIPARPFDLFDTIARAFGASSERPDSPVGLSASWQQVKVLLVDDNDMGRQMGRALLENVGIKVTEAKNGLEAIEKVEAGEFDLVLMDIQMPVLDGLSAARAIRDLNKDHIENLPIIAMTAHAFDEHKADSFAAGMNGHLTKPIDLETLYAELQRWLPQDKQQSISATAPIEPAENADLVAALPGIDVQAGIRRVVGDRQLYVGLLKKFVDQFAETERELSKELELQQEKEAIRRVHTLKGVAGSLGATQLSELARQLEEQLTKAEQPVSLKQLLIEHTRLLTALRNLPELKLPSSESDKPLGSDAELQDILEQMLPSLKSFQAQSSKRFLVQIQKKHWPEKHSKQLVQLGELVDRYQFNSAAEVVQALLNG